MTSDSMSARPIIIVIRIGSDRARVATNGLNRRGEAFALTEGTKCRRKTDRKGGAEVLEDVLSSVGRTVLLGQRRRGYRQDDHY